MNHSRVEQITDEYCLREKITEERKKRSVYNEVTLVLRILSMVGRDDIAARTMQEAAYMSKLNPVILLEILQKTE